MGDAENNQPSKKRAAGVQLSRDNPGLDDNEETPEQETGTFKRASDEVLASRRIVKVRRQHISSSPSAPDPSSASNPFAAIRLVPSGKSREIEQTGDSKSENKVDEAKGDSTSHEENAKQSESKVDDDPKAEPNAQKDETGEVKSATDGDNDETNDGKDVENQEDDDKNENGEENATDGDNDETNDSKDVENQEDDDKNENGGENAQKIAETASFGSFHQLSSGQNAFSGITGTGFSSTSFSFGSLSKDGSTNSLFGGFGASNNENSPIFGTSVANTVTKSEGSKFPPMQEVSVETGEENEEAVFTADSVLFEFVDGSWKERGKGELKVNVSTIGTGKARLVMRSRGNYRLILNASLFPEMKLTDMEKRGITFACVNSVSEGKGDVSTIALKFKDAAFVEDFRAAVMEHKGKSGVALKTPENSPKASAE